MKKSALAAVTCLAFFATGFAQSTDSVYSETKVNGTWQKNALDIFTRDAGCSLVSALSMAWNESSQSWVNSLRSTYTYGNAAVISVVFTQSWDALDNAWVNYSKALFTGNGGSKRTYTYQTWDALSNLWINSYRIAGDLDSDGRTAVSEFDLYSNNEWQKIQRSLLSYDMNDRIAQTIFQMWSNNVWTSNSKTTYSYTGKGITFDYLWDNGNKAWTLFRRTFNDYRDNTALAEKSFGQISSASSWENAFRGEATYNNLDLLLSNFQQYWDANTQEWVNSSKLKLDYYADGSQDHFKFEAWDAGSNSWSSGYRSAGTDVSCLQSIRLVPVSVLNNKAGVLVQNKNGNNLLHRVPATKTNPGNTIQRTFNPLAGNGNTVVYDFSFRSGDNQSKQYGFELILSSAARPKNQGTKKTGDVVTTNKNSFVLSPNPAKTYFNINLSAWKNAGNIVLKLSDASGKLIMQQKMYAGIQNVYLPLLQKGVYIVTITSGKEIQAQKLVID